MISKTTSNWTPAESRLFARVVNSRWMYAQLALHRHKALDERRSLDVRHRFVDEVKSGELNEWAQNVIKLALASDKA